MAQDTDRISTYFPWTAQSDVVLRSTDYEKYKSAAGIIYPPSLFFVGKAKLSTVSPCFSDMFEIGNGESEAPRGDTQIPSPSDQQQTDLSRGLPVVQLEETGPIMSLLLRCTLVTDLDLLPDLEEEPLQRLAELFEASHKYSMPLVTLHVDLVMRNKLLSADPSDILNVYSRARLFDNVRLAGMCMAKLSKSDPNKWKKEDVERLSKEDLFELCKRYAQK